jgi:hypothetical protein
MASLRIPEDSRLGLKFLLSLSDETAGALVAAIEQAEPTLRSIQFAKALQGKVHPLSFQELRLVVDTLIELYVVRETFRQSVDEFLDYLLEAMNYPGDFPDLEESEWQKSRSFFKSLLSRYEVLGITAKAQNVLTDHEHTFSNSRVLTDVRPIFGEDVSEHPKNAVILHMLRVHYFEAGETKAIVLALDSSDVQALMEVLQRAQQKEETLKKSQVEHGIRFLEPD